MKDKYIWGITIISLVACLLHAAFLFTPFNNYLYSSLFKVLLFVSVPLLYYRFVMREKFTGIIFVKGDGRNIRLAILLGIGVFLFIWGVYWVIQPWMDSQMIADALEANGITRYNFHWVFVYIVVINATLEQIFFRGFIFITLYKRGFVRYAHGYSALLFSLYHVPIIWGGVLAGIMLLSVVGLVAAGLIFNFLAVKCKNLAGSIIVHVSANFALNTIVLYNLHFV
ncbi:MAG: CPBP family intramembrane metalloprotease [Defluviitaleaceae bacterium]|nr:CPBP family intramembrane metalloprotease [Defluviitaleaceae bacterium]MCL2261952.1 CPBP family intramembrane metalloprotease [Defluviitaleaceae bacterium]